MVRLVGRALAFDKPMTVELAGSAVPVIVRSSAGEGVGDADLVLCLSHQTADAVARTGENLVVTVDNHGVVFAAELDLDDDPLTTSVVARIRRRIFREMSFGARVLRGRWTDNHYEVLSFDWDRGELSILPFGAGGPATSVEVVDGEPATAGS